jgi:hypothetical protein
MLNSETWYDTANVGPVQRARAEQALSTSTAVFKFVMHHRPLYCSSTSSDCNEMTAFLRSQVELMYRDQGVGAVMCGHVHNFERTYPVFNSTVVGQSCDNASAPVYFVNGGAGNPEGQAAFSGPIHDWSAFKTTRRHLPTLLGNDRRQRGHTGRVNDSAEDGRGGRRNCHNATRVATLG